jgi:hypothetical protein
MQLSVTDIDLFIKNQRRPIDKVDPIELLSGIRSLLMVGSGPSAQPERVASLAQDYDLVITINNAMHIYPRADYYSFEFDFRHQGNIATQLSWITEANYRKFLIKPFCLSQLSQDSWNLILERDRDIAQHRTSTDSADNTYRPRTLPKSPQKVNHLKALRHGRLLKKKPRERDYLRLIQKGRRSLQWRGSLSLWLDIIHLAEVEQVGLIGTDLSSGYATQANPFNVVLQDLHGTNADLAAFGGRASLLSTLGFLAKNGYLEKTRFAHFHGNQELASLI